MPKISVIMGVFNENNIEVIKKSILSILNQTYKDFELIICDDGSTDNTLELITKVTQNDNRVRIIKNEKNMGLAYTLNRCIEESNGEYIARMDIDDCSKNERFEKQIKFLEDHQEYSVVGSNSLLFNKNGVYGKRKMPEIIKKEDFLFNNPIMHPTVMLRKRDIQNVYMYNESNKTKRVEDYDLWMRMFAKGYKMYNLQEYLFEYREDKKSLLKRKYRYRINEAIVRYNGFKALNLLPRGFIYVIKPLIVGIIPNKIKQPQLF